MSGSEFDTTDGCPCASCLSANARAFERELLAAKLEAEMLHENQGGPGERAYRRGWNMRARAIVLELRGGK